MDATSLKERIDNIFNYIHILVGYESLVDVTKTKLLGINNIFT